MEIIGPTGVGKSAIAVYLAQTFAGEVISADSMQVYRGFDIGTDKMPQDSMAGVIHYGLDIYHAGEQSTAFRFMENAWNWCHEILRNGHLPIICGGTAMYLRILQQGVFPEEKGDSAIRKQLKDRLDCLGLAGMWQELHELDPEYADRIGQNDERRILRGLEIHHNTGLPPTQAFRLSRTPFGQCRFIRIGLNMKREELYKRIDTRVDRMIARGLLEETRALLQIYPRTCPPFQGLGYKEMLSHLDGLLSLDEAVALIKQHSRNYAKRQLSWWRQEKDINWFEPGQRNAISEFIRKELDR